MSQHKKIKPRFQNNKKVYDKCGGIDLLIYYDILLVSEWFPIEYKQEKK